MKETPEPADPVRLSVSVIAGGKYYRAGEPTPFSEASLPEHLRQYIAVGDEDFYHPSDRNFYDQPPGLGEPPVTYQMTPGGQMGRSLMRQAAQVASGLQEQLYAEQEAEASNKLDPETEEVLQSQHDARIQRLKAEAKYAQDMGDAAYQAAQPAEPPQLFVKRGGEMAKTQNARLKAGELCFVRRENGEMEAVGHVDSRGEPPEPEIYT